jgi:hypothetical protein
VTNIKIVGCDKDRSTHTENRWEIYFKLSAMPDGAWIRRINDLTRNDDIRIYGRVEVRAREKLLVVEADGSHTAEQIKEAIDQLLIEVNSPDDAAEQLGKLKF